MAYQRRRTALILSSGAMRGAYQCGVLKAFKEYNLVFDVVVGSSAGAYNGVRYLADQMDICEEIYVEDLNDGRFIKPWNLFVPGRHFLDLDYLVDEVCRMESKVINMDKVIASRSEFYVNALEVDTMVTRYFDGKKNDIYRLLKATAAIPLLYSGKVMINGKQYIDGGLLEPVPVWKAIDLGCKELCLILNRAAGDTRASLMRRIMGKMPGQIPWLMAEHDRLKGQVDRFLSQPHAGLSITIIRPRQSLPVGRFTSDSKRLQDCIDDGYRDGLELARSGKLPHR